MFSSRYQNVTLQTSTKDATIKTSEKGSGSRNQTKYRADKLKYVHAVTAEKEGYKKRSYAFQLTKYSPTIAFIALDLVVPVYGWIYGLPVDLSNPKTRKFDSKQTIPALVPYELRKENEKFLLVNNTAIDAKSADITYKHYNSIKNYNLKTSQAAQAKAKNQRKRKTDDDAEDMKISNTIFTDGLNATLKKMNFVDTTNSIFTDYNNSLYLDGTIKKIKVHNIYNGTHPVYTQMSNHLLSIELMIEWNILDYYKQKVHTMTTNQISDLIVASGSKEFDKKIMEAMTDNLEYALLTIRKELANKNLLAITSTKQETFSNILLNRPASSAEARMNDFLKSGVTVKVDEGHGSGVIISDDGYILTNYHVVAGTKKIEVILNDGSKVPGELVRKNTQSDLALIKIGSTGLTPLLLSNEGEPEIGVDVWAIGTPKSIELGQSVSKGVLSGIRKANGQNYIQTDVSINSGNSGGALITKSGTVIGIVTSKLMGIGTEGVGFAIPASQVFEKLSLQYQ